MRHMRKIVLVCNMQHLDIMLTEDTAFRYCLAKDMGAAPSILQVLSFGPIVFFTWALGPNFNPKFRLIGPWKWDGAASIMQGELWRVIKRRKGIVSKFSNVQLNAVGFFICLQGGPLRTLLMIVLMQFGHV